MLDTMSDLAGKVDRKARKPWITQKVMDKMEEGSGRIPQRRRKEELQKTETRIEKCLRSGQKIISGQRM
jgi:hypothetical protein